ncbi:MAG: discoidin domain-containing protein [Bacteroidaceae bacterium]|nr:discoidin domain-containing protein [Bacteroidaceae bacterium]
MIAWTGVMAQTAAEYEAALAAITDGAKYKIFTEVSGTKYYVTSGGTLTNVNTKGDAFEVKKITETSGDGPFVVEEGVNAVGIQLTSSVGTRFTNAPLADNKAVLVVTNFSTSTNNRAPWESQVFFLKDGKFAIRTCNTIYDTSSWKDAGRVFWTYAVGETVVPQYTYDPDYIWELEDYTETAEQTAALAKVQGWPAYIQSAAGLVKDPSKYYSNAKQTSEGSYEALLDGDYESFFHSCWSNGPDADHYLQAELSEATQKFEFYYKKRSQNNNNRPTKIIISGGNSADGEFTDVKTIDSGLPTEAGVIDYMSSQIDLGAAYKFVRFTIPETNNNAENNGHKFFTFSEFYMFPGNDAAAQLAPLYNNYSSLMAGDLTETDIATINEVDVALKSAISTITVTYELYEADGTTLVGSKEVVQKPYSAIEIPASLQPNAKFYDVTTEGTIGETDCTIKIIRTLKPEIVGDLTELSNNKAYTITCDRGAMLTNGTTIASTSNSEYASAQPGKFAIISYEDNYYLYSVADSKFVANNGYLVEKPSNGVLDAIQMQAKTVPYFMYYFVTENGNYGVNTNGTGALGGIVINSWMNADAGNQYYMIEAADFDPANALKALDAQFHPQYSVIYKVKDAFDNIIFTSDPEPVEQGAVITTLPEKYHRTFYTYDEVNVTITETGGTDVVFTATWGGPFVISKDFESAHWYDMVMRSTWYVTSDVKDGDGAYKTQDKNSIGLGEPSYHWAFVGDGYNGFKIFNKAEGADKSFGWTDAQQTNAGIPTIMDNNEGHHLWKIVASTSTKVPANSFCLNVPGTNLYINQYGGAGGSVKFWNSTNNIGDDGSAFTVFDIPEDYKDYVKDEVAPELELTGPFSFTDAAKATIGYDPAYKESCTFEQFKSMKLKMQEAMKDVANFVMPETGYYHLKNKNYPSKGYMGIDPSDANMYGDYVAPTEAKHVVKLIKVGDATYNISLMGKFAPATVAQSTPVKASDEAGTYTVVIKTPGYAAFQADTENNMSCLHRRAEGDIVGWSADADASMWAAEDATSINLTVGEAGYATAYLPFPVEVGKTLAIPAAKGAWTFDDGTTGTLTATSGVTVADGVATVPVGDNLAMATGAESLGTYTLMMDVKVVNEDNGRYTALFLNNVNNTDDGSLFIYNHKTNGRRVGIALASMGYGGSIELDTWYRIVVSCENSLPTVYVNGVKATAAASANDRWTLADVIYFFADNLTGDGSGEENKVQADELRFWDIALTADEIAMLGAYGDPEPVASSVAAYAGVINQTWLDLVEIDGTIPAMTGVVLKGDPGVYEFAIAKTEAAPIENNDLKGTLEPIDAAGKYVLAKPEGEPIGFYLAESGKIKAGKAYLELPSGSDVKAFLFAGDATGIANVEKNVENGPIYNLAGQRLNKVQKGINIVNGKKVLY